LNDASSWATTISPHLKATHGYIFGEMYPWAGELRTVRIAKGGDLFALPEHTGPYLTALLADLARENRLQELEREQFVERPTHYYAEINAVHPFPRGQRPRSTRLPRPDREGRRPSNRMDSP
jgi:fido (protein-threonine AMPylation protein)